MSKKQQPIVKVFNHHARDMDWPTRREEVNKALADINRLSSNLPEKILMPSGLGFPRSGLVAIIEAAKRGIKAIDD